MLKKLSAIALSIAAVAVFSGAVAIAPAKAATTDELQAQITALLAQITALQSQLASQGASAGVSVPSLTRDLTLGSKGADVKALQVFLNANGAQVSASGAGSPGNETEYFGNATKAALAKFQAAKGISPAAGYCGTKTRAYIASMASSIPGGNNGGGVVVPTGAGLTVALASNTPATGTVVAAQAIAPLASFTFTNGDSVEAKVTNLKFQRLGVSADTTLSKVYLYEGTKRLTDDASVSSGVINFNDAAGLFTIPAGSSKTITVKSNILTGTSGQTIGVGITAATSVTTSASAVKGTYPINGNTMTVATATLATFDSQNSVTPGAATLDPQEGYTVWQNSFTVGNRAVNLNSIMFRKIGSAANTDIKNFKLYIDGVQVGSTVESLDSNGYVSFDLSSAPKSLAAGSRTFQLVADVIGGSSFSFKFSLYRAADVNVVDSEYGAAILVRGNGSDSTATFTARETGLQEINSGSLTLVKKNTSPSGTVVKGASGATLATYELKAYGEKIKVENLQVYVDSSDNNVDYLKNGALYIDGVQVGSISNLYELNHSTTYTEYSLGSSVIVEPGKPRTLEVKADLVGVDASDSSDNISSGDTLKVYINATTTNAQRMTSGGYINVPDTTDVAANTLTVGQGTMSAAKDQAYGSQSVVVPATNYLLGKFSLASGTNEQINLNTLKVSLAFADEFAAADLTNVYIKYGAKTTSVKSTISSPATWSVSEALAPNSTMAIEVYGDIAASAVVTEGSADTVITSFEAIGQTAGAGTTIYSGVSGTDAVVGGQTITAVLKGNLTVTLDSNTPTSAQVIAGSTQDAGALKVKLASSREDIYVKTVTLRIDTEADDAALASLALFAAQGSGSFAAVSTAKSLDADGTNNPGYVTWNLSGTDRILVPKNGTAYILVKPTYVSSGQTTVSSLTPAIYLANIEAETGSGTVLEAEDTDGSDLVIEGGILIGGATPTFAADGTATSYTALGTTQTMTANAAPTTDRTGSYILISADANATYNNATDEIAYVLEGNTSDATLYLQRGVYGKTVVDDAAGNIYFLAGVNGNAMTVVNTKPTFALASDSPSGATTGGSQKVIFKFNVSAANNAEDTNENKVSLTHVDITTTKSLASVTNLKLYPSDHDNDASYVTTCSALSTTKWRCAITTTGSTNEIIENTSKTFIARADVGYSGAGSVDVSIASFGTSSAAGDVKWSDSASYTTATWINQSPSYLQNASAQTTTGASGTRDETAPTISSLVFGEGATTTANTLDLDDTITITFSEMIDASDISSSLIPGGSAYTVVDAAAGDISMADTGVVTIAGIATTDVDGGVANASTYANTATLNAAGTQLILTITALSTGTGALSAGEVFGDVTAITTTLSDANGNALADVAVNASGAI